MNSTRFYFCAATFRTFKQLLRQRSEFSRIQHNYLFFVTAILRQGIDRRCLSSDSRDVIRPTAMSQKVVIKKLILVALGNVHPLVENLSRLSSVL
jgi:hypothetical protein